MEESAEQILSTLEVIHRFMSAHSTMNDSIGNIVNLHEVTPALRLRTVSESENNPNPNTLGIVSIHLRSD